MGDIYVAPVTTQFAGFGNVFIMPDQAAVNAFYNKNNPLNATSNLGSVTYPRHEGDTGTIESYWPCVGAMRIVFHQAVASRQRFLTVSLRYADGPAELAQSLGRISAGASLAVTMI